MRTDIKKKVILLRLIEPVLYTFPLFWLGVECINPTRISSNVREMTDQKPKRFGPFSCAD